jgi:hypothetical protein
MHTHIFRTALCLGLMLGHLMLGSGGALAQGKPEIITLPLTRPAEPMTLNIDLISAQIEVIGEERKDAQIAITMANSDRRIKTPSGLKTLSGGSGALEITEEDNVITVDSEMPMAKVQLVVRIPRRANLALSTANDSEIKVRDVTGTLQLTNINGPVTATNVNGSVIAESVNDAITVGLAGISANEATSLSSLNGDLTLSLPANAGAELRIDNSEGQIDSDFELDVKPGKPSVTRSEGRRGVSVRVEDAIVATINGGGPVIKLKTLNGKIKIAKNAK